MSERPTFDRWSRLSAIGKVISVFFSNSGALSKEDRRLLSERARAQSRGAPPPPAGTVADLEAFADKVARWAYKIVDEDVEALRAQGHSEDAIWEATLSATMGISMDRLGRALELLDQPTEESGT